jgi:4-oxalmesaconate hydratase
LLLPPGDNAIRLAARTTRVAASSLVAPRLQRGATHRDRTQIASEGESAQGGFAPATAMSARRRDTRRLGGTMIIDCHGHYTTSPRQHEAWRTEQITAYGAGKTAPPRPIITDDEIRASIVNGQLKLQQERGTDLTIFSPRAAGMGHHLGDAGTSEAWAAACNELIHRVCTLFPRNFVGVCMLPQSAGTSPRNCIAELERCVLQYGFVGCNLNPDPSGGYWQDPPLGDRYWYPLYEKMVELDVPAMIHVSAACNPAFHTTGSHYLNGDTAAFMQCLTSDLFKQFPTLKFIIPHGGGAVPYHWGRFRGLAQDMKLPPLTEHLLRNVFFDTCVYHLPGQELLAKVIPLDNIVFASEMIGAVRGIDPETRHHFDDTKRYIEQLRLAPSDKQKIYEGNARHVYSRLPQQLDRQFAAAG